TQALRASVPRGVISRCSVSKISMKDFSFFGVFHRDDLDAAERYGLLLMGVKRLAGGCHVVGGGVG
ncbi:hypothetical protein, partial [Streptomyces sp. SID5770]|uniref:hypothetical protein n=1 Tax=Streptomyces sp. SID5770 TaxID=2690308 RepID=UPI001F2A8F88